MPPSMASPQSRVAGEHEGVATKKSQRLNKALALVCFGRKDPGIEP